MKELQIFFHISVDLQHATAIAAKKKDFYLFRKNQLFIHSFKYQ